MIGALLKLKVRAVWPLDEAKPFVGETQKLEKVRVYKVEMVM